MVEFNGKYKLEKNENMEEVLKLIGVNLVRRKLAVAASQTCEVRVCGQEWTLVSHGSFKTLTWPFTLGQESVLVGVDGNTLKATFTLEGRCLTQRTSQGYNEDLLVVREFTDDGMIQHVTHQPTGTKATIYFKRV